MKKQNILNKAVVLAIVAVFIGSAFVPAVGSIGDETSGGYENGKNESTEPLPLGGRSDPWWNAGWQYRKKIEINHDLVEDDLTNFPVLISLDSDSNLSIEAQNNGYDIVFTNDSGNKLNHEIELFNGTSGELVCWVNVTNLSGTEDTVLYMYYGNSTCGNQENPVGVWDSDYLGVWHLNETSGTVYDSTDNDNDGTPQNQTTQDITGYIDGADIFNSSGDDKDSGRVYVGNPDWSSVKNGSISAWVKCLGNGQTNPLNTDTVFHYYVDGPNYIVLNRAQVRVKVGGTSYNAFFTSDLDDDTWHYVHMTMGSGGIKIYVDGDLEATNTGTAKAFDIGASNSAYIGLRLYEPWYMGYNGTMDEVRVSGIARDTAWFNTSYNNQKYPSLFFTFIDEDAPLLSDGSPSDKATDIALNPTLSIDVNDSQGDNMDISFMTNESGSWSQIGSTQNGGNDTYTQSTTSVFDEHYTWYWWSVNCSDDSSHWTNETYSFKTEPVQIFDWLYYKKITIDHTRVTGNSPLLNFPVLISIDSDDDLRDHAFGDDIRFKSEDKTTTYNHEIELFEKTTGQLVAWVNVTSLSDTADTVIWMNYGNSTCSSQENPSGVWDSDYQGVWHLDETSGTDVYDSTSNDNDGTSQGGVSHDTTGKIGSGDGFDGTDDAIVTSLYVDAQPRTLSYWVNYDVTNKDQMCGSHDGANHRFYLGIQSGGNAFFGAGNDYEHAVATGVSTGSWYYIVTIQDGSTAKYYLDGVEIDSFTYLQTGASSTPFDIGADGRAGPSDFVDGVIDEVRVSYTNRSVGWMNTSYKNQNDPSSFFEVGPEMHEDPVLYDEYPGNGATDVGINPTLSIDVEDLQGDNMNIMFMTNESGTWSQIGSTQNGGNDTYTQSTTIFDELSTMYWWSVNCSDTSTGNWTNETYCFTTTAGFDPFNQGWQYRKKIVIDHMKVEDDFTNFPVLISLDSDPDLAAYAQDNGNDILFMDDDGVATKLNHEIELFNSSSGDLTAWVNVTSLSSTVDTILYMYYGNGTCVNQQNPEGVWDSDYQGVWHLNQTSSGSDVWKDSTGNGYDGTDNNMNPSDSGTDFNASGKADGAVLFDGSNDNIDTGFYPTDNSAKTLEYWVKYDDSLQRSAVGCHDLANHRFYAGVNSGNAFFGMGSTNKDSTDLGSVSADTWYYIVVTGTGSTATYYFDAVQKDSFSYTCSGTSSDSFRIGSKTYGGPSGDCVDGVVDEVRVSYTVRSLDWIKTTYNNLHDPSSFIAVIEEDVPLLSNEYPSDGATAVEINATLSIYVEDPEGDNIDISFMTNESGSWSQIGSTQNGGNDTYTQPTTVFDEYNTWYWWSVNCSDVDDNWANETYSFKTEPMPLLDWPYVKKITIDHTKVDDDLSNFPVLISIDSDPDLASHAFGTDIFFKNEDRTLVYDHEIELFEQGTGRLVAWVNVPSLSSSEDTVLYMYYGNSSCSSQENPGGVWDSNFTMVQHLNETSGMHYDSTLFGNNGTGYGSLNQDVSGKIAGADSFDGGNDYIDCGHSSSLDITGELTAEVWLNFSNSSGIQRFLNKRSNDDGYLFQLYSSSYQGGIKKDGLWEYATLSLTPTIDQWYHMAFTFDGSDMRLYLDGVLVDTASATNSEIGSTTNSLRLGAYFDDSAWFNGVMDEARISDIARSSGWLETCYDNQNDPSSFCAVSGEMPAGLPIVFNPSPSDGVFEVPVTLSQLSFNLTDYDSDLMNYTVGTSPYIGSGSGNDKPNGRYTVPVGGLIKSTAYTWYVNVTDGEYTVNETFSFTTEAPIHLASPSPDDDCERGALNPDLSINVSHDDGLPVDISFRTDANGVWETIGGYTGVGNGSYTQKTRWYNHSYFDHRGVIYNWSVNVTDGSIWFNRTFSFDLVDYIGDRVQDIAMASCWKFGYIKPGWEKNKIFAAFQEYSPRSWAAYDLDQGWYKTYQPLFAKGYMSHSFWGYWDGLYHQIGEKPAWHAIDSPTFEGFSTKTKPGDEYYFGSVEDWGIVGATYTFNDTHAWIMAGDGGYVRYWPWDKDTGWGTRVDVCSGSGTVAFMRTNQTTWYFYFLSGGSLHYVKSTDVGQTWGSPQDTGITATGSSQTRTSLAKYGNNYYVFLVNGGDAVCYHSTDGENWSDRRKIMDHTMMHHGCLLHQGALISTANRNNAYHDEQFAGILVVPEMISYPGKPTDPSPANETVFDCDTTSTYLNVTVHGNQTYDVAFYWANGTFIGEDKLLEEGDIASVEAVGLSFGRTYEWYAVSRGATLEYTGGEPESTSDENWSKTWSFDILNPEEPQLSSEYPEDESKSGINPLLSIDTVDYQGNTMDVVFMTNESGIWQQIGYTQNGGNNTYTQSTTVFDSYNTRYWWSVNCSDNENHWTNETYQFTTYEEIFDWPYHRKITINHTKVLDNLSNFPVLISIDSDSDLRDHAFGDDFIFRNADNSTVYNHEIELFDKTTGQLVAWVNVTSLSSIENTVIWMYYGNSTCETQEHINETWDDHYLGVWHLDETSGTVYDSTDNDNNGTPQNQITQDIVGLIDGADSFESWGNDKGSGRIHIGSPNWSNATNGTVTAWIKCFGNGETNTLDTDAIFNYHVDNDNYTILNRAQARVKVGGTAYDAFFTSDLDDDSWHYVTMTMGSNGIKIYVNGTLEATNTGTTKAFDLGSAIYSFIGLRALITDTPDSQQTYYFGFNGTLDEVRVSDVAHNDSWITTCYNNQNDSSSFYEVGDEITTFVLPVVSLISPSNNSVLNEANVTFTASVTDDAGIKNVSLYTNTSGSWQCEQTQNITKGEYNYDSDMNLWMHFNNDSGVGEDYSCSNFVYDYSDNENDGTIYGPTYTTDGKYGGAFSFDGVNDQITVPSDSSLDFGQHGTIAFWMNWSGSATALDGVISRGAQTGTWCIRIDNGSDHMQFRIYNLHTVDSGVAPSTTWEHWAITINGSEYTWYRNGTEVASDTYSTEDILHTGDIYLGYYQGYEYYNGLLDEVAIYDRSLTASEVEQLYLGENITSYKAAFTLNNIPDDTYQWNCLAYDIDDQSVWAENNWKFTVDAIPDAPVVSNVYPADNAESISLNPTLSIDAEDPQGDPVSVMFMTNESGSWVQIGSTQNDGNDTYTQTTSVFDSYYTRYWWSINVSDGSGHWNNQTYMFTTRGEVTDSDLNTVLSITANSPYSNYMNVTFYGNGKKLITLYNVANGSTASYLWDSLAYGSTHRWNVTIDDGISINRSRYYTFTVIDPPTLNLGYKSRIVANLAGSHDILRGDYNNDLLLDFACEGFTANSLSWFKQEPGYANFTSHLIDDDVKNAHDVQQGDINGDGQLDLVCLQLSNNSGNYNEPPAKVFWYEKDKTSTTWTRHLIESNDTGYLIGPRQSMIIDMDEDGDMDVVVATDKEGTPTGGYVIWYENLNGDGSSWKRYNVGNDTRLMHQYIKVADLDDDGNLDFSTTGTRFILYWGPSDPKMDNWTSTQIGSNLWSCNQLYDFDGDGDLDIVAGAQGSTRRISIFENPGGSDARTAGKWTEHIMDTCVYNLRFKGIRLYDMNADGHMDVIAAGNGEGTPFAGSFARIYFGHGNLDNWDQMYLINITETSPGLYGVHEVEIGDFNNDNIMDIILAGCYCNKVILYYGYNYSSEPEIEFVPPTPANDTTQPSNSIYVNTSVDASQDSYAFIDFDDSALLWLTMDILNSSGHPIDSSSHSIHCVKHDDAYSSYDSKFGRAFLFDNAEDYIDFNDNVSLFQDLTTGTISAWIYWDDPDTSGAIFSAADSSDASSDISLVMLAGNLDFFVREDGASPSGAGVGDLRLEDFPQDSWHHVAVTQDGSTIRLYVDGAEVDSSSSTAWFDDVSDIDALTIGARDDSGSGVEYEFAGQIDDLLIFNRSLGSVEILALYNSTDNSLYHDFTDLSIGQHMFTGHVVDKAGNVNQTETRTVTVPAPQAPMLSDEYPLDGATDIAFNPTLSIDVNDSQGDNMDISFMTNESGSWVQIGSTQNGGNNTYTQPTTMFNSYSTTYWWSVNCSDDMDHWTNETYHFTTPVLPTVTLTSPSNNSVLHESDITFVADVTDDKGIKNVSLYTNTSGSWQLEQTLNTSGEYGYDSNMALWMHFNNDSNVGEDYSSSNLVYDYSDYHNSGTNDGANYTESGKYGGAFSFDGTDDKITVPSDSSLDFGQHGTIAFWLNWSGSATANDGVLSRDGSTGSWCIRVSHGAGDHLQFRLYMQHTFDSGVTPSTGWEHWAITINGSEYTWYQDGVEVASETYSTTSINHAGPLYLGLYMDGSTPCHYNGLLDEVAIYDKVLSESEIGQLAQVGYPTSYTARFTMDDIPDGTYHWNCQAYDTDNRSSWADNDWTFTVDAEPEIGFISPTPADGTKVDTNHIYVNTSIFAWQDSYAFIDMNASNLVWLTMDQLNATGHPIDSSSHNIHCVKHDNAHQTDPGRFNRTFTFDNDEDYISFNDSVSLFQDLTTGTISAWVYWSSIDSDSNGAVFSAADSADASSDMSLTMYLGNLDFFIRENGVGVPGAEVDTIQYPNFPQDSWHHVAVTQDGSTIRLYVDGAEVDSSSSTAWFDDVSDIDALTIGARDDSKTGVEFELAGRIDDFLIFNRSLDSVEILALYNSTDNPLYHDFTGLSYGQYVFTGYVVDEVGYMNQTETRTVTLEPVDPMLSDEYPLDSATGVVLNPTLSIDVEDPQGDNMDISFMTNESGSWVQIGSTQNGGNNTYTQPTTVFDEYNKVYWWSVNCSDDGGHWTNETYHFTTAVPPTVTLISPFNNSVLDEANVTFVANITDNIGIKNVSLYTNVSGSWQLEQAVNVTGDEYNYDSNMTLWMHFNNDSSIGEDYGSSNLVYDYSDQDNNGTKDGPTYTTDGKYGGAFSFDGTDDKITIPSDSSLDFGQHGTIAFWMNWSGTATSYDGVLSRDGEVGGAGTWCIRLNPSSSDHLQFRLYTQHTIDSGVTPSTSWEHWAITINGSEYTWYQDGVEVASETYSATSINHAGPLYLGLYNNVGEYCYYNGLLDEVAIYNRTLSESEISQLASCASFTATFNLNSVSDGTYYWNCLAYDIDDQSAWADSNWTFTVSGADITLPEISDVDVSMSDPKDTDSSYGWENISCTVTDNVDVDSVWLNITYPDLHTENVSMTKIGDTYYYNTTFSDVGSYGYFIWANDTSDNVNTSSVDMFDVPPNWDINMDGICNYMDVTQMSLEWQNSDPTHGWIREDITNDGWVNYLDITQISLHWFETWP